MLKIMKSKFFVISMIVILLLVICFAINSSKLTKSAPKKAEGALAYYLSQFEDLSRKNDRCNRFIGFEEIYFSVESQNFTRIVKISGSLAVPSTYPTYSSFSAIVEVGYFDTRVISVTVDGEKI